jgi:GT2 family glycosyltransferase
MKKITLVIPVYNHLDYTSRCIQSLDRLILKQQFKHCNYQVVVVDDGSTDGTAGWLAEHHPDVVVLHGDGTLWWSGGINKGAKFAIEQLGTDYILLWNNDITPVEDYFHQLDQLLTRLGMNTLVGSKILYHGNEQIIWSFGGTYNPVNGKKRMIGMDEPDSGQYSEVLSVDWLPGMGTLVPVDVIEKIGYWDDRRFPQYHGDSDFTFRAKKAGFEIMVRPDLKIWNDKSSSGLTHGDSLRGLIRSFTSIRSNLNIRKNILFYRRHADSWRAYRFLIRYYMKVIGGFVKWKVLALVGKHRLS